MNIDLNKNTVISNECSSCEATFDVIHSMDTFSYQPKNCYFCGAELSEDEIEENQLDYEYDEYDE
jgi:hypothetical protein